MTTKVTVDASAGWPVEVTQMSLNQEGQHTTSYKTVVSPNTAQDFHVHSHSELHIKELPPLPDAPAST